MASWLLLLDFRQWTWLYTQRRSLLWGRCTFAHWDLHIDLKMTEGIQRYKTSRV
jgi:hypothetical protein